MICTGLQVTQTKKLELAMNVEQSSSLLLASVQDCK